MSAKHDLAGPRAAPPLGSFGEDRHGPRDHVQQCQAKQTVLVPLVWLVFYAIAVAGAVTGFGLKVKPSAELSIQQVHPQNSTNASPRNASAEANSR